MSEETSAALDKAIGTLTRIIERPLTMADERGT